MNRSADAISLLSYLDARGHSFYLDIPVLDPRPSALKKPYSPFITIDQSKPFSTLVKACLTTHAGIEARLLVLLKQRDDYKIAPDPLIPVNNIMVDNLWRQTLLFYKSAERETLFFPGQLDSSEKPARFKPLFFCNMEKKFFHPPCPECGAELDLCNDDTLLRRIALLPYSTSSKRYLFCPDCSSSGDADGFYQYSRSSGDTTFVSDRFDLVRRFKRLKGTSGAQLPCTGCRAFSECHISDQKAILRISVFAFYPFYMVALDAPEFKATQFISLLSGADIQEINDPLKEQSDRKTPLVFDQLIKTNHEKPRRFFKKGSHFLLEVLFLKLSLIREVARQVMHRTAGLAEPRLNLTTESIWINPGPQDITLPWLWNFRIRLIDLLDNHSDESCFNTASTPCHFHCLTALWFYSFLVDQDQSMEKVYQELKPVFEKLFKDPSGLDDIGQIIREHPVLSPGHMIWSEIPEYDLETVDPFWERVIDTGLRMQTGAKAFSISQQLAELIDVIDSLKDDIQEVLFPKIPVSKGWKPDIKSSGAPKDRHPEHALKNKTLTLTGLLSSIKQRWKQRLLEQDGDILETVVLSSPAAGNSTWSENDLDKTVVMTPEQIETIMQSDRKKAPALSESSFDDLEETLIMTSARRLNGSDKKGRRR